MAYLVYSAYVQWIGLPGTNHILLKTMDFCRNMDDIHNGNTAISLNGKTPIPVTTNRQLTTFEGGEGMDFYIPDAKGRSRTWGGGYREGTGSKLD